METIQLDNDMKVFSDSDESCPSTPIYTFNESIQLDNDMRVLSDSEETLPSTTFFSITHPQKIPQDLSTSDSESDDSQILAVNYSSKTIRNCTIIELNSPKKQLDFQLKNDVSESNLTINCTIESNGNNNLAKTKIGLLKQLKLTDMYRSVKRDYSAREIQTTKSDCNAKSPKRIRYNSDSHSLLCENVHKICEWVSNQKYYRFLFTELEINRLNRFFELAEQAHLVLCLRLFTRQTKWYSLAKLCETLHLSADEVQQKQMLAELTKEGFIESDFTKEPIRDLLDYLTLPDLKGIYKSFRLKGQKTKKDEIINALIQNSNHQCTLTTLKSTENILRERICKKMGVFIRLQPEFRNILHQIHVLYSLAVPDVETANDIYNLMNKIRFGAVTLPKVRPHCDEALFSDRFEFKRYVKAFTLRKEFEEQLLTHKNHEAAYLLCIEAHSSLLDLLSNKQQLNFDKLKPAYLRRFSATWVYCKLLTVASRHLTKRYPDDVLKWLKDLLRQEVYCSYKRGFWYLQAALVCRAHLKEHVEAAEFILNGLLDERVTEVYKHELSFYGSKVKTQHIPEELDTRLKSSLLQQFESTISRTIQATVVHNNEPGQRLHYVRTTENGKEYSTVEETAINYYINEGAYTQGVHCEGRILSALFFVLFWDILYKTHVPNTFLTELQTFPIDLYTPDFYSNRSIEIDQRLNDIRANWSMDYLCAFVASVLEKNEQAVITVTNFGDVQSFSVFVKCIGRALLAAVCERFVKDFGQYRSGLPDLFLWNEELSYCCFVEVKSENDKLSTNQKLWLNYLQQFGASVEVCHVKCIGSRRTFTSRTDDSIN